MKHIISISLGSRARDHKIEVELMGEAFIIERRGTDGDMDKVISLVKEFDGKVDAFGMGGIDFYVRTRKKLYYFREATKIAGAAKVTPMLDGSKLKSVLEHRVVTYIDRELNMLRGKKVLLASALDRFGMANGFEEAGCEVVYGDAMFTLGLPWPIHSRDSLDLIATLLLPLAIRLPFRMLYPIGENQSEITPKYGEYYRGADVIAGDFHMIRKYMPDDLTGKIIITNTTTPDDVLALRSRGVETLVTTTPVFEGRSFGNNVIEATLVVLSGKRPEDLSGEDYMRIIDEIGFRPGIQHLQRR